MKKFTVVFSIVLVGLLTLLSAVGEASGELGLSVGGIFPQGDFAKYSDPGPAFLLRVNPHIPGAEAFSGWINLGVDLFSSDESEMVIEVDGYDVLAKKNIDEYGITLHIGLQLGSASRKGFFRPRAALAPGFYYSTLRPRSDPWIMMKI